MAFLFSKGPVVQPTAAETAAVDAYKLESLSKAVQDSNEKRQVRARILAIICVMILTSPLTFLAITYGSNSFALWMLSIAEVATMRKR